MKTNRTVTMRDIAERANVSQTTVSFVLNERTGMFISENTKARVISAAHELGYRPNQIARALAKGGTDTIGIWLKSLHSTYYRQLTYIFDDLLTRSNYQLTFARNASVLDTYSIMQDFPALSVEGLIAVDIPLTVDYFASHAHSGTPIVSYGCHVTSKVDCVAIDLTPAVQDALEHLYSRGRRRIGFLIDEGSHSVGGGPREDVYKTFAALAGFQETVIVIDKQTSQCSRQAVSAQFAEKSGAKLDALLCFNDDLAIGAIRGLKDLGQSVPTDVSVIGCDNIAEAGYLTPSLSTIALPDHRCAQTAWEFLKNRMTNPTIPIQFARFPAVFTPRESS